MVATQPGYSKPFRALKRSKEYISHTDDSCHIWGCLSYETAWRVLSKETWQFSLSYKNKRLLAHIKGVIKMGRGNLTCNWVGIRKEERENKQTNPGIDEIMKNGSSEKGHSSSWYCQCINCTNNKIQQLLCTAVKEKSRMVWILWGATVGSSGIAIY